MKLNEILTEVSRREFLQKSAAGAALAGTAGQAKAWKPGRYGGFWPDDLEEAKVVLNDALELVIMLENLRRLPKPFMLSRGYLENQIDEKKLTLQTIEGVIHGLVGVKQLLGKSG